MLLKENWFSKKYLKNDFIFSNEFFWFFSFFTGENQVCIYGSKLLFRYAAVGAPGHCNQ